MLLTLAVDEQSAAQPADRGSARPLAAAATLIERGQLVEAEALIQDMIGVESAPLYRAWQLLGRTQLLAGRPEAALSSFTESLHRAPQFVPALIGRAKANIRLGRATEASADLRRAVALDDAPPLARLLLGEVLLVGKDFDEGREWLAGLISDFGLESELGRAARLLELAAVGRPENLSALRVLVGENPNLPAGYLALGILQCRLAPGDDCAAPLRAALEIDDQDPTPWLVLGVGAAPESYPAAVSQLRARLVAAQSSMRAGEIEETQRLAAEILSVRPHHVPAQLLAIGAAEREEDYWKALAGYRGLLEWLPGLPGLEAGAARVARAMGAIELAECWIESALETSPRSGSLVALLAAIQADGGKIDDALASSAAAIALGETGAEVHLTRGRAFYERMQLDEALAAYRQALTVSPAAVERLSETAVASLSATETTALRQALEQHLEANPESRRALYQLGMMAMRDDDPGAAETYFEQLARLDPEDPRAFYNLGQIHARTGDAERSEEATERFRRLKSEEDERWLLHNQAFRRRLEAQAATDAGRPLEAVGIYGELASAGTALAEDYLAAGRILLDRGDFQAARSWFEGLLSTDPYDQAAIAGLAEALARAGQREQAELYGLREDLLSHGCGEPL